MISGLVFLILVGAVVWVVARALAGRSAAAGPEPAGDPDLRDRVVRFFRLALLFGAVVLVAEGVAGLLAGLLADTAPSGDVLVRSRDALARSAAFVVVGAPVAAGLAAWTRRRLLDDPDEIRSAGWNAELSVALVVSLVVALLSWDLVGRWAIASGPFDAGAIGRAVAWSAVWAAHWRLAAARSRVVPQLPLHQLAGAALSAAVFALGVGRVLRDALRAVYDAAAFDLLLGGGTASVRRSLVIVGVGGVAWWWYWLRHVMRARRDERWSAYVLLVGVLGTLATAVVGGARVVHLVLQWSFGDPAAPSAAAHFAGLPAATAALGVGLIGWLHHRSVLGVRAARVRSEVDRVYEYLAAAVGLVTLAVGVTVAFAAFLEAVTGADTLVDRGVANTVVTAATASLVGGAVWGWFWRAAERHADDHLERSSVTRRVYLFGLFGVAAAIALVSLVVLAVTVFEDVANGELASSTFYDARVAAALVATMGVVAGYHAVVFRADRVALEASAPQRQVAVRDVVLVADDGAALAALLRERLGVRVRVWQPVAPIGAVPSVVDAEQLVASVGAARSPHVLVVARTEGAEIVPFRAI